MLLMAASLPYPSQSRRGFPDVSSSSNGVGSRVSPSIAGQCTVQQGSGRIGGRSSTCNYCDDGGGPP
jgi:hypothetical protein